MKAYNKSILRILTLVILLSFAGILNAQSFFTPLVPYTFESSNPTVAGQRIKYTLIYQESGALDIYKMVSNTAAEAPAIYTLGSNITVANTVVNYTTKPGFNMYSLLFTDEQSEPAIVQQNFATIACNCMASLSGDCEVTTMSTSGSSSRIRCQIMATNPCQGFCFPPVFTPGVQPRNPFGHALIMFEATSVALHY